MSDLASLIRSCIDFKKGNKDFALFGYENGTWGAEIGYHSVFWGGGDTPEAAMWELILDLKRSQK